MEPERIERWSGQAQEERERRSRIAKMLEPGSLLVVSAAQLQYMTNDIPYRFRQDTDFAYLTGFEEPDALFVMRKDRSEAVHAALVVKPKDPWKEMWDGKLFGEAAAKQFLSGHEDMETLTTNVLRAPELLHEWSRGVHVIYADERANAQLKKLKISAEKVEGSASILQPQRFVKSHAEQQLAQEVADLTADSLIEVIKHLGEGVIEGQLDAYAECAYRIRGAAGHAFPPVVAGGDRALTLHYISNNQRLRDGELVLFDSGAELHWMNSDVSRTWPVNGEFTPPQRKVYEAVLKVQKACIDHCVVGETLSSIHMLSERLMTEALHELGILRPTSKLPVNKLYPHSIGHWLGMDVHDTPQVPAAAGLRDGVMLTIEPGLYLPAIPEIPEEFHGIGIRIEDNILVKPDGPVNLTRNITKDVDDMSREIYQLKRLAEQNAY